MMSLSSRHGCACVCFFFFVILCCEIVVGWCHGECLVGVLVCLRGLVTWCWLLVCGLLGAVVGAGLGATLGAAVGQLLPDCSHCAMLSLDRLVPRRIR